MDGLNSEPHRYLSEGVEKWVMKEGAQMGYKVAVRGELHGTDQELTNFPRKGPMANISGTAGHMVSVTTAPRRIHK